MAKYKVSGKAINRNTREPIGKIRDEIIDTKKNSLFYGIKTAKGVEEKYEAFWNDLNPKSREIVKVVGVKKL